MKHRCQTRNATSSQSVGDLKAVKAKGKEKRPEENQGGVCRHLPPAELPHCSGLPASTHRW